MIETSSYLAQLADFAETMPDALVVTNHDGHIVLINKQTEILFGYDRTELLGQVVEYLIPKRFRTQHVTHRLDYDKNPQVRPMGRGLALFGVKKNGTEFPVDISLSPIKTANGLIIIAAIRDITDKKQLEKNLQYLAEHDTLTGLVNRHILEDRITQAIALTKRNQSGFALLFLDLDGFKQVNDAHGHDMGDLVLCTATNYISKCLRTIDTLARLGGDEFALLLLNINDAHDAITVAKKILDCFSNGVIIDNKKFLVTISIGIALYTSGDTHQNLLKKADLAMYYVKNHGKNGFKLYDGSEVE